MFVSDVDGCRRSGGGAAASLLRRGAGACPRTDEAAVVEEELARCSCTRREETAVGLVCPPPPPLPALLLLVVVPAALMPLLRRRRRAARVVATGNEGWRVVRGGGGGRRPLFVAFAAAAAAALGDAALARAAASLAALKRVSSAFHPTCGMARAKSRSLVRDTRRPALPLLLLLRPAPVMALGLAASTSAAKPVARDLRSACRCCWSASSVSPFHPYKINTVDQAHLCQWEVRRLQAAQARSEGARGHVARAGLGAEEVDDHVPGHAGFLCSMV